MFPPSCTAKKKEKENLNIHFINQMDTDESKQMIMLPYYSGTGELASVC